MVAWYFTTLPLCPKPVVVTDNIVETNAKPRKCFPIKSVSDLCKKSACTHGRLTRRTSGPAAVSCPVQLLVDQICLPNLLHPIHLVLPVLRTSPRITPLPQ